MILELNWGLSYAVPPEATGAWGCRAIVSQDGYVDLVPDRIDQVGDEHIFDLMTREFPTGSMRDSLGAKLRAYEMVITCGGRFTLYKSHRLAVMGDTKGSGGHSHFVAWTCIRDADRLAEQS